MQQRKNIVFVPIGKKVVNTEIRLISDITVESDNHSFITTHGILSSNSSMGKQAIGVYTSNYRNRYDTIGHVLNYPQRPLVQTRMSKILNNDSLPCGMNCIVAIATYTGFNQEDSIMLNKAAIDRGMFVSTSYKTFKEQNNKNHSTGEEEFFCNPKEINAKNVKPYNYDKIGDCGFVKENTYVSQGDVIIGKCMPNKEESIIYNKDTSLVIKANENGVIDKNFVNTQNNANVNGDGYTFAKVRIRNTRIPCIGDKFSSRHGQKGTVGMIYNHEDMPFMKDGTVPDIIINPHAIPSRMTIAQLMECILGKACCVDGFMGDGSPFNEVSVEDIAQVLENHGIDRTGNEVMYNSRTGEQMNTLIFCGPTYYQRLKHMVNDKIHSRSSAGPVVLLTRQPAEGRARDGGLRLGEMEVECNWAHGISSFLKERFMECSDNYRIFVCKKCGMPATVNKEKNMYSCKPCRNKSHFAQIRIPYATKLMLQEVQTMSIATRYICGN
jgi:DNA-directed RNA polymerase II subunit RPB2